MVVSIKHQVNYLFTIDYIKIIVYDISESYYIKWFAKYVNFDFQFTKTLALISLKDKFCVEKYESRRYKKDIP